MHDLRAQVVIRCNEQAHDTSPSTSNLPGQFSSSILPVRAEAKTGTEGHNRNGIPYDDRVISISL
jgi:hypothetical protein